MRRYICQRKVIHTVWIYYVVFIYFTSAQQTIYSQICVGAVKRACYIIIICISYCRMFVIYYIVLLLLSLQSTTTGSVYIVTLNDHYYPNTTYHHRHSLQHYLLNTTKYFTSNTQLLFLSGLHHLHTDLITQNIHNISLIGNSTSNDISPDVVIRCEYNAAVVGVTLINITNLIIWNIAVQYCTCVSQIHTRKVLTQATETFVNGAVLLIAISKNAFLHQLHIQKNMLVSQIMD